ncbi:MAG: T9SS type A sorting domain-containing protein, partial [Saprospiraceae bacterium]|nr:T9SS type A sorting domain-containing protein [Saprospiraceae bacterium]
VPAQLNWTALNGPIGLNEQTPSTSASGIVFLNRKNVHQFDISFDYGDTWEAHDLSLNTFPFSYQILQLTNDQTYVLLNDRLNAFRQNTKSWEPLPGFDDSKRVWFDGSNRLWRVLADGQLSYSDNEGNSFTTVFTDVANSTLLAMYNDAHNLMVEHDAPSVKVYHFTSAGQKQFISFAANNFYVDWIKYNPYTGTAFMKTNDPLGYIKKSTDGGLSWTAVDFPPDFPGIYVTDLLFTNAGETWAVTGVAALISTNEGNTWSPFPPIFPEDYYAPGTLGLSVNGQKVYYYVSYCGKQGFYRSLNHGVSWTDLTPKFYFPEITDIVKTNDGTLYAEACRKFNVEVSTNEGQSWQTWTISTPNGLFTPVSICKSPDGTLYVPGEGVVYRSTNNGANWDALDFSVFTVSPYHKMSAGLDGSVYLFHHQHGGGFSMDKGETWTEMLIPPDFSSQLYFGDQFDANGNFYRSGQYFISKFIPSINYTDNVVLPGGTYIEAFTVTGTGRLLVMTTDIFQFSQILYYSDDEGQSFQQSGPIPEWSTPARLISGPGMVLLQVNGNYYRSLDDGITWSLYFSTNAFQSSISCLYFSPDNYLYAGLNGEVIHRTGQKVVASKEPVDQWVKLSVYPNPATEKLSIQIPFDGLIQYTISDALGRTMLNSRTDIEARSNLNVDIQHLASGAYFIELRDESGLFFGKSTFYKQK